MLTTSSKLADLVDQVLHQRAFMMVYQPILSLKSNSVVGYEALCRPSTEPAGVVP